MVKDNTHVGLVNANPNAADNAANIYLAMMILLYYYISKYIIYQRAVYLMPYKQITALPSTNVSFGKHRCE